MDEDVLFVVKKENLETGLRGIPVGYCVTSSVDPEKGLFYCGRAIKEIVSWSFEKVVFLLWHGKEPTQEEENTFTKQLAAHAQLSKKTFSYIQALPRESHPMDLLVAALMIAKTFEGKGDYETDALHLIAKMPLIVAAVINYHGGWEATGQSDPKLGFVENFARLIAVPGKERGSLSEILRLFLILHLDHGGGNLSAFVGKAIASGLQDLYGSIAGAMSALAGPRHGLANQLTLTFVQKMAEALKNDQSEEGMRRYLEEIMARKELLYGFGHAVLRVEDPRATVQYDYAEKHFGKEPLVQLVLRLRKVGSELLLSKGNVASPYPNVDAVSGTLLTVAGFPYPEYYTLLFGLSRTVGIAIQIVYERKWARQGKGTPIIRPKYLYKATR